MQWRINDIIGWTDDYQHHMAEPVESSPSEPQPPARCNDCGRSLYLVDRDNNGTCDECWVKAEKISYEEHERVLRQLHEEQRKRQRRIAEEGF